MKTVPKYMTAVVVKDKVGMEGGREEKGEEGKEGEGEGKASHGEEKDQSTT